MLTRLYTTREKLMRAALEIVAEDGFSATTTAAIAARAGFAEGTLYRHFKGKDDLLIEAYRQYKREVFESALAAYDTSDSPEARFKSLWLAVYCALSADPEACVFGARFAESSLSLKEGGAAHEQMNATLTEFLSDPVAAPQVKPMRPELLAALFYAPITGLLKAERQGVKWTEEDVKAAAQAAWDSWRKH